MRTLEDQFVDTIEELGLPKRDLEGAVLAQLISMNATTRARPRWVLALAVVVIAVISILVVPPAREAVADWLGIGATAIEVVPEASLEGPDSTSPRSADVIGEPADGISTAGLNPMPTLGAPLAIFDDPGRGRSFTWAPSENLPELDKTGVGAVLSIRPADRQLAGKLVAAGVAIEFVMLEKSEGTVAALWIGGTHELVAAGASRSVVAERVLLWVDDGIEYRLELNGSRQMAVTLAEESKGGTELLPTE